MKRYLLPIAALLSPLAPRAGGIEYLTNDVPSTDEVAIPPARGAGEVADEEIDESFLTLATPPADLTTTTYRMEAFECSVGKNLDYQVQLGFSGNEVWIQGISEAFPQSWVKGDMEGNRLIINMDQYLGIYNLNGTDHNIWVTGINHELARFEEPQFIYNPNTGIFIQLDENWLVVNGSLTEWKWLNNMSNIMLSPVTDEAELVDHYALVTPPEHLPLTTFTASGLDYSFGAPEALSEYPVEIGLAPSASSEQAQGELEIFVRGLFAEMPEAWVKGTVSLTDEASLLPAQDQPNPAQVLPTTFTLCSPQYMGKWYGSLDCWLMGVDESDEPTSVTFTYDEALGAYVQQPDVRLYFNDTYDAPSPMALQMLGGLTLKGDPAHLLEGIASTTIPAPVPTQRYDLAGKPLQQPPSQTTPASRSIYIQEGRKFIGK